ncbi:MAG: cation transporter [Victivallales bacterium]|nr:cation transporter [Victivallales bacterium]
MLIRLLCRLFVNDISHPEKPSVRAACGVFSGYVGVAVNVLLFVLKMTVGIIAGSISIAADAVNNLSDAGSGVVTIVGFKLAAKPADKEHPFGHGRIELCCGIIVAVIIMMMGGDFLKEAVTRIFSPEEVKMTPVLAWLLGGSLLFKLWLFFFYRYVGRLINSGTCRAAAFDSLSDMAGTTVVLLAVLASRFTSFPVDGVAGVIVAAMVLIGGIKILKEAVSPLLGEPPSSDFVDELRERLLQCEGITGVHDIIIHNYGPNQYFATAHAEVVENNNSLLSVHDMLENAEIAVGRQMPVHLLLHCDPYDPANAEGKEWRVRLENAVADVDKILKVYDFRLKKQDDRIILTCHLLVPLNYPIPLQTVLDLVKRKIAEYPPSPEVKIYFVHPFV